jgi:glycosyltransferase involved in cell wall biosynthesis
MVTTVYDMIAEDRGMLSDVWADHVARKRDAILAASRIIAISHATRADLIRFYPQVEDRVRVVPLAADHLLGPDEMGRQSERSGRGERYAVFVGQRADYKNFRVVLEAMLEPAWPRGLRLHVVGAPLTELEKMWIDRHCLSDRVRYVGRLTDAQLREQYKSAECLIFPSLIEGFGIPVLEAQLCGCPAVLSDIPVFREIAGATAVFFDPRLSERLAEAVAAIGEPEIRRQLVGTGLANVRRFSWSQAAEQWFEVHGEAARGEGAPG